jgi:hypothetical protein
LLQQLALVTAKQPNSVNGDMRSRLMLNQVPWYATTVTGPVSRLGLSSGMECTEVLYIALMGHL